MEACACDSISLSFYICAPLNSYSSKYSRNPVILSMVKIWRQFRLYFKIASPSLHCPSVTTICFCPQHLTQSFLCGRRKVWFISNNFLLLTVFLPLLIILRLNLTFHNLIYLDIFKSETLPAAASLTFLTNRLILSLIQFYLWLQSVDSSQSWWS